MEHLQLDFTHVDWATRQATARPQQKLVLLLLAMMGGEVGWHMAYLDRLATFAAMPEKDAWAICLELVDAGLCRLPGNGMVVLAI